MALNVARLPIHEVEDEIEAALRRNASLVLIAPPGAGKTTVVPGLLVDRGLAEGQVWVLEPRRLAARLSATRVAAERGRRLGDEVGYRIRFEDRTSKATRIVYVTEGILSRRLVSDPFLDGVGAVVIDEFHERSLHADLALAFLREVQESRPELKILVMSATLQPGPVAAFLGDCPVVKSEGRQYPLEIHYLERPEDRPVDDRVVAGVKRALREAHGDPQGDILAFLPGAREIARAERRLRGDLNDVEVLPLHGELARSVQERAVSPRASGGPRRVILATNVAESSLTIPGVDTVVDGGLAKSTRFDVNLGIEHLELGRISRFSADQRAGRSARLGPGRVYRTWTEAEQRILPVAEVPEVARVDLAAAVLLLSSWSGSSPESFSWFERPPKSLLSAAERLLRRLGALPAEGFRLTPLGEVLAQLPVHPRLGRMVLTARALGVSTEGARLAALASERDILVERGPLRDQVGPSDLLERLHRVEAVAAGERPESLGLDGRGAKAVLRAAERLERLARSAPSTELASEGRDYESRLLRSVLAGFPDRVAKRKGSRLQLADGGRARLADESLVKDAELLVAVDIDGKGAAKEPLVRMASALERGWLQGEGGGIEVETVARFDPQRGRVEVVRVERFGTLELSVRPDRNAAIDPSSALIEAARADIDRALPITDEVQGFLHRYSFVRRSAWDMGLPELSPASRSEALDFMAVGKRSFEELRNDDLARALLSLTPLDSRRLNELAPTHLPVPSGRSVKLRYLPEGAPVLSVRLQEVFGLHRTPTVVGGRVAVKMELLAPNMRPVQITQDLESFWSSTYAEVRKELRRRYPKHQWPEDPAQGIPSTRVRPKR